MQGPGILWLYYCRHDTETWIKFNRQQENNGIVNSAVEEILLHENQKVSSENGVYENTEYDYEDSKLYQIIRVLITQT